MMSCSVYVFNYDLVIVSNTQQKPWRFSGRNIISCLDNEQGSQTQLFWNHASLAYFLEKVMKFWKLLEICSLYSVLCIFDDKITLKWSIDWSSFLLWLARLSNRLSFCRFQIQTNVLKDLGEIWHLR